MEGKPFVDIAQELDLHGLIWQPEIGDEISNRQAPENVSILVDPKGMTPGELRNAYLWLPSIEQLVFQIEARQGILFHAGLDLSRYEIAYKTVIKVPLGHVESKAQTMRLSVGIALCRVLRSEVDNCIH